MKEKRFKYSLSAAIVSAIIVSLLGFGIILGIIGYISFTNTLKREYKTTTYHMTVAAKALVDVDSFDDYLDGVKTGVKRMLKPAFYVTMANILFTMMLVNSNGTIVTYVTNKLAGLSSKFNVFSLTGSSIFASLLFNHYDYMINAVGTAYSVQPFMADATNLYSIIAFVCQGIFGVIMLLLPTSMVLIGGLSILDVKLKDWFKYIWVYAVEIFVIVLALSFIVTLV